MRDAELAVQWYTNVYSSSRYQLATKIVCGEKARRIGRVDAWQVNPQALENDECPCGVDGDSQDADDPVNVSVGCPAKEEEPDRRKNGRKESRAKAIFMACGVVQCSIF